MKMMRKMLVIMSALALLLVFNPAAHALSVTSQFNTPLYITINPGETKPVMFATPSGQSYSVIKAKVENLSASGKVVGNYYVVKGGTQHNVGSIDTSSTQTVWIAYYSPPFNGLLILNSANTTEPITVRVTFEQ